MKYFIPFALLAALLVHPVRAQESMSTDRPDFTEAPVTVGQGTLQVEAGGTHQSTGDSSLLTSGEGLLRYGLRPRFELRLGLPSLISGDGLDSGLSDMSVGVKWNFASLDNGVEVGLVAGMSLPTGADHLTSDDPNPTVLLVAGMPLGESLSFASQISNTQFKAGGDWESFWLATAVLSASLTEQLGAFAELKVESLPELDNRYIFHTGLVYPVSENVQIDVHLGTGLSDISGDEFIGLGFAYRR